MKERTTPIFQPPKKKDFYIYQHSFLQSPGRILRSLPHASALCTYGSSLLWGKTLHTLLGPLSRIKFGTQTHTHQEERRSCKNGNQKSSSLFFDIFFLRELLSTILWRFQCEQLSPTTILPTYATLPSLLLYYYYYYYYYTHTCLIMWIWNDRSTMDGPSEHAHGIRAVGRNEETKRFEKKIPTRDDVFFYLLSRERKWESIE